MKMKRRFSKKLWATLIFSLVTAVVFIVHGIFLDLDISQIERLTLQGFLITFIMTFSALLILEKIFTLEEDEEILRLKKRILILEKKRR